MRKLNACLCLVLFLSLIFAPTVTYAKGGPDMPPPPKKGLNIADFLAALKLAIAAFRGGGDGEPLPEPLPEPQP